MYNVFVLKPYLDVAGSDERRLALEVPGIHDVRLSCVQDEFGQMDFALVDGVQ